MFQEYFILEYYTPTKLQAFDQPFSINGVRVLHVASQLENGHIKYNNSTSTNKLISQINTKNGDTYINASAKRTDTTLFTLNKQLLNANYFNNDKLNYQFEVTSLTDEEATIKITYSA
jgi:hypothetical protein